MKAGIPGFGLILLALNWFACAPHPQKSQDRSYRFEADRSRLSDAPVMRKRAVQLSVHLVSEPPDADVYTYDDRSERKEAYIGKTPCNLNILIFHITEYADMTVSYWVEIPAPHRITRPVDFSDPQNRYGEITFAFLFEKKGYAPRVEQLPVKATNEVLVKALAGNEVPDYTLKVVLEK